MNHFLHLLILLPALFTTIIALPTFSDDTSNSWTDSVLDNTDTLLAGTFGVASPPYQPDTPANTPEKMQPPTLPPVSTQTQDQDWTKPMFLCCTNVVWWNDEETQCTITTRDWNNGYCMSGQGVAKYCPKGYKTSVATDCYKYRAGPGV